MKAYVIIAMLGAVLSASAQEKNKNFVSLTVGVSSPTGAFAQADAGSFNHWNNKAGYAKSGLAFGVDGTHYFWKHLGLSAGIGYADHGGFSGKDASNLSASYTDAFAVDESTVSTSGRYRSVSFLAGPVFSVPLKKFTIDFRVQAGAVKSLSTPQMTVLLEDQTNATFSQKSSTAVAFAFQAGAGLRYALNNKLSLLLRSDYLYSPGIKIENENRANNAGRLVTKQPLAWVNTSAGVAFTL